MKKVAHLLLTPNLWNSPPNDALARIYEKDGYKIDYFSPRSDDYENIEEITYGFKWLLMNMFDRRWSSYDAFSCTSEDPVAVAGVLSFIWRKPLVFLADEIKAGGYYGNRKERWKKLCRWSMRRAKLTIVNDNSRIQLQKDYAELASQSPVIVYPGCFLEPPAADDSALLRNAWDIPKEKLVLGFSGACSLDSGIDLALDSLDSYPDMHMIAQPLSLDPLAQYLIKSHRNADRIYFEKERLSWQQSWRSMGGVDIGVAIYTSQSPQFQLMGISSNRLCMFLAMGVPVIVNNQDSFKFLEDYNCGVLVENLEQFNAAVKTISENLEEMKANALRCAEEYIDTKGKFLQLESSVKSAFG